jgi:hypothetical protein
LVPEVEPELPEVPEVESEVPESLLVPLESVPLELLELPEPELLEPDPATAGACADVAEATEAPWLVDVW